MVFILFQMADDRMALVSGISLDPEAAIGVTKKLPPKWIEGVDEVELNTCVCSEPHFYEHAVNTWISI